MTSSKKPIIFCELLPVTKKQIQTYSDDLRNAAPSIGNHGLNPEEFWDSGIFHSAIERIRGRQSASMKEKRLFVETIFDDLLSKGQIADWKFVGNVDRHDYEVRMLDGWLSVVETKGCLDGNNTNIFERPPHADEFVIWSLCQNPGSDPRHNAWSGVHTRLSAEIIHRKQKVDGLIIWDMVCGTKGRPCPKIRERPERLNHIQDQKLTPPPCLYLFPRSIPDPRNNAAPACWKLEDVKLLHLLWTTFHGDANDVIEVHIETQMKEAELQRRTRYSRDQTEISCSDWTTIKRAR
ncbi:MAG: hypothetical protein JXR73_19120 [Candidatus Omnitrophica bacterium]|nr:hypothetical protein [Candidatus Omnitrophota bacterium]